MNLFVLRLILFVRRFFAGRNQSANNLRKPPEQKTDKSNPDGCRSRQNAAVEHKIVKYKIEIVLK